jgi:hypothetical protein
MSGQFDAPTAILKPGSHGTGWLKGPRAGRDGFYGRENLLPLPGNAKYYLILRRSVTLCCNKSKPIINRQTIYTLHTLSCIILYYI